MSFEGQKLSEFRPEADVRFDRDTATPHVLVTYNGLQFRVSINVRINTEPKEAVVLQRTGGYTDDDVEQYRQYALKVAHEFQEQKILEDFG